MPHTIESFKEFVDGIFSPDLSLGTLNNLKTCLEIFAYSLGDTFNDDEMDELAYYVEKVYWDYYDIRVRKILSDDIFLQLKEDMT